MPAKKVQNERDVSQYTEVILDVGFFIINLATSKAAYLRTVIEGLSGAHGRNNMFAFF